MTFFVGVGVVGPRFHSFHFRFSQLGTFILNNDSMMS